MNTTTDTPELHALRSAQLKALVQIPVENMFYFDNLQVYRYSQLCGAKFDTRNLSDKALEEIQVMADKYLERLK